MQSNLFVTNIVKGVAKRIFGSGNSGNKKAELTWLKTKYLKHATTGKVRSYIYKNRKIYYTSPPELLHTLREIFIAEIYKIKLPDKAYIIDCGANIGLAVLYLKEHYPNAEIVAFEPDEQNFELLKKNIGSFNLSDVTVRKEAVWIEDTTLDFSNDGTMGSRIQQTETKNTGKVKAIRLKNMLDRKVDFLKIDIEGAEFQVLKDIRDNLANVNYLFLEYHGNFNQNEELTETFNIIQNAGFNYYIKEAAEVFKSPFTAATFATKTEFDVQLNLFCFRKFLG